MRLRIVLLVIATSSLVLVSFLVPLAAVLRTFAADRAMSAATAQVQSLVLLVPSVGQPGLRLAVDQVNAESSMPVTIVLPGGITIGPPSPAPALVRRAQDTAGSVTVPTPGGTEILYAVQGMHTGTAVVSAFVPNAVLHRGVTRAWLLLGGVGLFLLLLSVAVADQLARSLVRPLNAVALVSDRLAAGDMSARAPVAGPPAVRRAAAGLNRLAERIGELLTHERETVADLSHRLRTPLTALRIDAESLHGTTGSRDVLLADVSAVERTVNEIIRAARRGRAGSRAPGSGASPAVWCDAGSVVLGRAAFWQPLAEDQSRLMTVAVQPGPLPVRVSEDDLAACADVLLENVFAHTPEGAGFEIRLSGRAGGGGAVGTGGGGGAGGGAVLVVADDGPGFPAADATRRGLSARGSTGLGLDIARRVAESAGGCLTIGRSPSGGGSVTLSLGPPVRTRGTPHSANRHRRSGISSRFRSRSRSESRSAPVSTSPSVSASQPGSSPVSAPQPSLPLRTPGSQPGLPSRAPGSQPGLPSRAPGSEPGLPSRAPTQQPPSLP